MPKNYADIAFSPAVKRAQARRDARDQNHMIEQMAGPSDQLDEAAAAFIAARDTFFIASVGEDGWPYVQHRGGPPGFLKVLDAGTLGFADFSGNRQYVTTGHVQVDDRVALILVDFPNKRRLKVYARARTVEAGEDPGLVERLRVPGYPATIERAFVLGVEAFDWNCPQHIVPRWTEEEMAELTQPCLDKVARLRAELAAAQEHPQSTPAERGVPTGWDDGGRLTVPVVVQGVRQLTPRVRQFALAAADGSPLPPFEAGAHLDLPVRLADGALAVRSYSLTNPPRPGEAPAAYEIAVLREADGAGGSAHLHEHVRVGDGFRVAPPRNAFSLDRSAAHHLLVAGGIGITPLLAMARTLRREGAFSELHYAARSRREMAFRREVIEALGAGAHLYGSDEGERLSVPALFEGRPAGTHVYVCGPLRLIEAVRADAEAAGWPTERVHTELFEVGAAQVGDAPFEVELARTGRSIAVGAGETVLEALEAAGVAAPFGCRAGTCRTCAVRVLEGTPDHRDHVLTAREKAAGDVMTTCVSRAHSDRLVLDL